jgi:hypothetical protein
MKYFTMLLPVWALVWSSLLVAWNIHSIKTWTHAGYALGFVAASVAVAWYFTA